MEAAFEDLSFWSRCALCADIAVMWERLDAMEQTWGRDGERGERRAKTGEKSKKNGQKP